MSASVMVALRIAAPPPIVFAAFTKDIGLWWREAPLFALTPRGDGRLHFEPGAGGRLVATPPNGKPFEIGRITDWAPPARLAFTWRQAGFAPAQETFVEVRFEAVGAGETRVTVEHRGWDAIPQEHAARHGFPLGVFQLRLAERWRSLLSSLSRQIMAP